MYLPVGSRKLLRRFFKMMASKRNLRSLQEMVGGILLLLKRVLMENLLFYVECKRYARINKVSVDLVRALYGVQTSDRINKACLVTSSYFTSEAINFARSQNVMIDLVDGDALHNMIIRSAEMYNREYRY